MTLNYKYLLYNHCKAVNSVKYKNIDYVFDIKKPYVTTTNAIHKLYYYFFSMFFISNLMSLFQTFWLIILSYGSAPKHLSFIMDGNRRFAKSINQPLKKGHELGSLTLLQIIYFAKTIGVKDLSVYAFSIENFNRSEKEVELLMSLLVTKLTELAHKCTDEKIVDNVVFSGTQIKIVGDRSYLADTINAKIDEIEKITTIKNEAAIEFTLYICCPYTSRNEIYHAIKDNVHSKLIDYNKYAISEKSLEQQMCLSKYTPECDLLIRTSGATRYSDYLIWQTHQHGSLVFSQIFWPDYGFSSFFLDLFKWGFYKGLYDLNKKEKNKQEIHTTCTIKSKMGSEKQKLLNTLINNKVIHKAVLPSSIIFRPLIKNKFNISVEDLPEPPIAMSITQRN